MMIEILRDVMIRAPVKENGSIIIKGETGGELRVSMAKPRAPANARPTANIRHLNADCYHTKGLIMDLSGYDGAKRNMIKIKVNGDKGGSGGYIFLFIVAPDNKLIEYRKLKYPGRTHGRERLIKYRAKTTHNYTTIKVICFEDRLD